MAAKENKLWKFIFVAIAAVLFLVGTDPAYSKSKNKSFLWKVTHKNAIVYILGSIHAVDESIYPLSKNIEKSFKESSNLVVEVDILSAFNEEFINLTMKLGMYLDGDSLKNNIDKTLYENISSEIKDYGMSMDQLNYMKPWFAASTIMQLKLAKLGYNPLLGIDLYFLQKAKKTKNILELESADFQLRLLGGMPENLQELFLKQAMQDNALMKTEMEKLINFWSVGDIAGLEEIIYDSYNENPEFKPLLDELIVNRNHNITKKIEEFLTTDDSYFVVVGAGHLVGQDGIINILRSKKYKLAQQ